MCRRKIPPRHGRPIRLVNFVVDFMRIRRHEVRPTSDIGGGLLAGVAGTGGVCELSIVFVMLAAAGDCRSFKSVVCRLMLYGFEFGWFLNAVAH